MFKKRNLIFISLLILGVFLITGCWLISSPTYTVTFDSQGGSAVDPQTVERGGLVIEPTAPTQTGYAFAGWYKELECTNAWDFNTDTVTSDVTLYAKWVTNTYTVTFDKNGGHTEANPKTKTATHGGNVGTLPTAPTRTGHTFTSWNTKANGSGTKFKATTAVTVDITVYAQWTINTYTVTYNGNGSTGGTVPSDSYHYEQGDSVTVLGNTGNLVKTQDGISLLFTGWNTAAAGSGTSYDAAATFNMGTENVTLYAEWSAIRATGPAGGLIFYDKGSVSDGWRYLEAAPSDQSEGAEWGCYETSIPGADGTAVGTGKQNTIDIENGCPTAGIAARLCTSYDGGDYDDWFLPSKDELNLMYENLEVFGVGDFADHFYWSSSENDADYAWYQGFFGSGLQSDTSKANTYRVRAVRAFRSIAPTYLVNYNANEATGGTVPSDSYHYEPAETVIVLHNTGNLVKTGYTFDGWNTAANGSGTDQAEGSTFAMGVSDVTLYAKWTANNYNITFDKNDTGATGTMADQTIASGSSANLTACGFTKAGWTFAGWAEASDGDVAYADEVSYTMGTADVTLYAKWTPPATYSLRDIGPAGGWIFYDNGSYTTPTATVPSWRYLEAAPSDQSIGALWGCYGVSISGADGTAVGTGEQNTIDILNECATSGIAADICADLSLSGYDDWFLPSKDELNLMYENLKLFVIGGFVGGSYWSSSEGSADYAWTQGFNNGTPDYYGKTSHLRVRAVRAF